MNDASRKFIRFRPYDEVLGRAHYVGVFHRKARILSKHTVRPVGRQARAPGPRRLVAYEQQNRATHRPIRLSESDVVNGPSGRRTAAHLHPRTSADAMSPHRLHTRSGSRGARRGEQGAAGGSGRDFISMDLQQIVTSRRDRPVVETRD